MIDPCYLSITELSQCIQSGSLSPVGITQAFLDRIDRLNPTLLAYTKVFSRQAIAAAENTETAIKRGEYIGPLHGIPYAVKDIFDVEGEVTMAGSSWLSNNIAERDCAVVRRLANAGMILLGKTHTVPFACDIVGINHELGTPHNPWSKNHHVPGGSSSGSAVAVAAGLAPMAMGSDTGGSVRAPAALCGTVGLKTTLGRVSRDGVYPLSWSYDSIGPLTRTVADASLVYQTISGKDLLDEATAVSPDLEGVIDLNSDISDLNIVFCESVFFDDVDAEVEAAVRNTKGVFESLGVTIGQLKIPEVDEAEAIPDRYLDMAVEAYSANKNLLDEHVVNIDFILEWMTHGKNVSAPDYFSLIRKRSKLKISICETMNDVDAILVPSVLSTAHPVDLLDKGNDSYYEYQWRYLRNTSLGNYLNLCGISVCCGFSSDGFPIGLMIYAKPFEEEKVLRIANAYENASNWSERKPDLSWI
jgi:aspartyl-tRNA(Asn)/glutamyl-tRNA(Gln) amidotransferase subunit A